MLFCPALFPVKSQFRAQLISGLLIVALGVLVNACGGNESNYSDFSVRKQGAGSALTLPKSINLSSGVNLPAVSIAPASQVNIGTAPNTDFSSDPVRESYPADANIAKAFANLMLCLVDAVDATGRVNQGLFSADVAASRCISNQSSADIIHFLVNSSRADNQSPQFIQIWLDDVRKNIPYKEFIEITVYQPVTEQYPFARFEMNSAIFTSATAGTPLPDWRQNGASRVVSTNKNGLARFEFTYDGEDFFLRAITQLTQADLQHGQSRSTVGSISSLSSADISESIFNDKYHLDISPLDTKLNQCSSRTDTVSQVWSYNLYNADSGQRIAQQSTPLHFEYTHSAANDRENLDPNNTSYGQSYSLEYAGPGSDLSIPLNPLTLMREFNLKDGTLLIGSDATSYLVKAVDISRQAMVVDMTYCADLDADAPSQNPDLDLQRLPASKPLASRLTDWPTL